jgi:glutamate N-acetyltransferase / amino-acid N-acetyltransferase
MAAAAPLSPLAPKNYPFLPSIAGVRFATAAAGVRYADRTDVMMALFDAPAAVAGVFTRSKCPSAPVDWCRAHLNSSARALIVNSGNANAFTGHAGIDAVQIVADAAAKTIKASPSEIFMASTGVIGEPLDGLTIVRVIADLAAEAREDRLMDAAKAIMTTDTYPKVATAFAQIGDTMVTINGIAKGAGMIAPDMATLLSYVFTDAPIASGALQTMLAKSVERSFNSITVDSDTSTSDTLMIFATGAAKTAPRIEDASDPLAVPFRRALDKLLRNLAQQVVRDGEGARKFIEIKVEGAATRKAAKRIAMSIANSPLVKTAVAGEDANWGRVVMAVGKAGEKAERDKLDIWFGKIRVAHQGLRDPSYEEAAASAYMKKNAIVITADLGIGSGRATVWTCDLTKEYVAINGDYRS